jgi:two-component system sensor histidine kinase HydH
MPHERSSKPLVKAPRRHALFLSVTYFLVTAAYIRFSTELVVPFSNGSVERLARLETIKGTAFMMLTAMAFYLSIRWVAKRTARISEELNETRERWAEAERQAAPAMLASVIAHDVANLLTVLRLNVEKMKRTESMPVRAIEAVAKFEQGTDRLTELVKRLRGASKSLFNEDPVVFDFKKSVEETLELMRSHVCCENVEIETLSGSSVDLRGYPVLVHQLVMNLAINAAEATSRAGRIRFTIAPFADGVSLISEDDGPGIAPSLREKVLGAFFTTKTTGTGLGLTSVRSCVEIHKGKLEVSDSTDLGGAKFTAILPNLSDERVEKLRHPERIKKSRQPEMTH